MRVSCPPGNSPTVVKAGGDSSPQRQRGDVLLVQTPGRLGPSCPPPPDGGSREQQQQLTCPLPGVTALLTLAAADEQISDGFGSLRSAAGWAS